MMYFFDLWRTHQWLGAMAIAMLFVWHFKQLIGTPLSILWGYLLISAIFVGFSPDYNGAEYLPKALANRTVWSATQAAFLMLGLPCVVFFFQRITIYKIFTFWVLVESLMLMTLGHGTVNGATFSAAVLAMMVPFLYYADWTIAVYRFKIAPARCASALAAIMSLWFQGATSFFVTAAMLVVFFGWNLRRKYLLIGAALMGAFIALAIHIQGKEILNLNGRQHIWKTAAKMWSNIMPWYGSGLGTWEWIGPYIKNDSGESFIWAHNDYLQLMFEGGVPGILLLGWVLFYHRSDILRSRTIAVMTTGYLTCMAGYYPWHFTITQVYGLVLIRAIVQRRSYNPEIHTS